MNVTDHHQNNHVVHEDLKLDGVTVDFMGDDNRLDLGFRGFFPNLYVRFNGRRNRVIFGKHCRWSGRIVINGDDTVIHIGDKTTAEGANLVCEEGAGLTIGSDCMLSYSIEARTSDSHSIFDEETGVRLNPACPVVIGNHVWVGRAVTIMPGVEIADGCVVALGSIVSRNCDTPGCIVSGQPARPVRKGIVWDRKKCASLAHLAALSKGAGA